MASTEVDDPESLKALAVFLLRHHSSDLRSIILARDSLLHYPLHIQYPYSHLINTLTNTHKISLLSLSLISYFSLLLYSLSDLQNLWMMILHALTFSSPNLYNTSDYSTPQHSWLRWILFPLSSLPLSLSLYIVLILSVNVFNWSIFHVYMHIESHIGRIWLGEC